MALLGEYGYVFFGYNTISGGGQIARNADVVYASIFFPSILRDLHALCLSIIDYVEVVLKWLYLNIQKIFRPELVKERFWIFMFLYAVIASVYTSFIGYILQSMYDER